MSTGRPRWPIVLEQEHHPSADALISSRSLRHGFIVRARPVLMVTDSVTNHTIAEKLDLSRRATGASATWSQSLPGRTTDFTRGGRRNRWLRITSPASHGRAANARGHTLRRVHHRYHHPTRFGGWSIPPALCRGQSRAPSS
jgi:hypothetical protein